MANLQDIVELSQALQTEHVLVYQKRCLGVRNRHSSCTKCVDACLTNAISVQNNTVSLDHSLCVACGACASVCPTQALVSIEPMRAAIMQEVEQTMQQAQGIACFACARAAKLGGGDFSKFSRVDCLSFLDESMLLQAALLEPQRIVVVDGTCKTCKYRACNQVTQHVLDQANTLLSAAGSPVLVERSSAFPENLLTRDEDKVFAEDRRRFFTSMKGSALNTTAKAAKITLKQKLDIKDETHADILKGIRTDEKGLLPRMSVARHENLLNALFELAETNETAELERPFTSDLFGRVSIDHSKCRACGMCVTFCTTGALNKIREEKKGAVSIDVEFTPSKCIQCRLCEDACIAKACSVSNETSLSQLFDFEPMQFTLTNSRKNTSFNLHDSLRRSI